MAEPSSIKHQNYEILNLIGYGLAKFESDLVSALGFKTKEFKAEYGALQRNWVLLRLVQRRVVTY